MENESRQTEVAVKGRGWASRVKVASALQYRDYRIYWIGLVGSVLGFQIFQVAQLWLVYDLTGSYLKLGFVGASAAIPQILIALFGGVIADRVDRRRLLIGTHAAIALLMVVTAVLAFLKILGFEHLMVVAFLNGALGGLSQPSLQAIIPHLIDRKELMNAVALSSTVWQGTRIVGPGIGGALIDFLGPAVCFGVTSAGFAFMVVALSLLHYRNPGPEHSPEAFFTQMVSGVSFILRNPLFFSLIGMSFFNAFFGLAYIGILSGFAQEHLSATGTGLGVLLGASGLGALAGTLVMGSMGRIRRRGWLIIGGSLLFGVFLIMFSFSRSLTLAMFLLVLVGAANSTYMIPLMTQLQVSVPDQLRGRVMGVFGMTYSMMPLGSLPMGSLASLFSSTLAITAGGIAVIAFSLGVGARAKEVRRL